MMNETPPVLVGERVFWLGSGSGLPKRGTVKWIGRLAEMGPGWAVGVELEEELPCGGIDGSWGGRKLFTCRPKRGLIVPAQSLLTSQRAHLSRTVIEGSRSTKIKDKGGKKKSILRPQNEEAAGVIPGPTHASLPNGWRLHRHGGSSGTLARDTLRRTAEEDVLAWMVERQRQHESDFLKRMDRREFNRSFDEGLAASPRSSYHSSRSTGSRRSSGIFSIFKWFKKEKSEDSDFELPSEPASPILARTTSITGSVDTLFSTATANSFAFIHPLQYRPFGLADQPEIRIQDGPETSTYRNRIRNQERLRRLEQNISLREKYRLYSSGTLPRSVDHIDELAEEELKDLKRYLNNKNSTLTRIKKKAPEPPTNSQLVKHESIDQTEKKQTNNSGVKQHRRTASEPTKVFHVKGKRKAPPPPGGIEVDVVSISSSNSKSSKRSRKKRRAPSPPKNGVNVIRKTIYSTSNEAFASGSESQREETASNASTVDIGSADVVCTDTLKLERGILKPNMDRPYTEHKICPASPVSPRPWYKRAANKDCGSVREKDKKKERDRRKVEDWMLESGIPRKTFLNSDNKYSIFSRSEKTDDKRRSQISILTNISELDREAAEIIKRGKEREKTLIDTHNAMYYNDNTPASEGSSTATESQNNPNNSSRDLMTLFNALTEVTKVTINPSIFSKEVINSNNIENKINVSHKNHETIFGEAHTKQKTDINSSDKVAQRNIPVETNVQILDEERPGTSSASSANGSGIIARVTIEELDEYDAERNSKSQVLYEANKQNRCLSPPIPTIAEMPEGSPKSSPISTINEKTKEPPPPISLPSGIQLIQVKQMSVWICPRCTLENLRWRITCEACDMWRPNPFEIREKANSITANKENKNEPQQKDSDVAKKSNNNLYPKLSAVKMNTESASKSNVSSSMKNATSITYNFTVDNKEKEIKTLETSSSQNVQTPVNTSTNIINLDNSVKVHSISDSKTSNGMKPSQLKSTQNNNFKQNSEGAHLDKYELTKNNSSPPKDESHKLKQTNIENKERKITSQIDAVPVSKEVRNEPVSSDSVTSYKIDYEKSDSVNDEVHKARLQFFKKSPLMVNKEENKSEADERSAEKQGDVAVGKINEKEKASEIQNGTAVAKHIQIDSLDKKNNLLVSPQENQNNDVELRISSDTQRPLVQILNDDIEKKKLKEMLIEMKHSLPKRPKSVKRTEGETPSNEHSNYTKINQISPPVPLKIDEPKLMTKPEEKQNRSPVPVKLTGNNSNDYAEAYLIESETIIEEVKIKKPSEKISSSVQTSGLVTQISPKVKPSSGKEIVIPVKIEENTIKDGILYTSTSNGLKRIGKGTFELMRPRDFANIKEIKTESKAHPFPLYANIPADGSNLPLNSEEAATNSSEYVDKLSKQLVKPQGVASFRARLDVTNDKSLNTLAVNRLLKRLEVAITGGNHELAAALARELAQLKVNCSVIRQKQESPTNDILLEMYVEDKLSHQGPFHIKVKPTITVKDLKELVEREYEIPTGVQRWILANQLAGDDTATLEDLGVNTDGFPVFLYLVAPDLNVVRTEEVIVIDEKPSTSGITDAKVEKVVLDNGTGKYIENMSQPGPSGITQKIIFEKPSLEVSSKTDINPTGTMALGWKCQVCTLMNCPTRPGCAACSAHRPDQYKVPEEYKPNDAEALRIENELKNDEHSGAILKEENDDKTYQKLVDLEKDDLIIYPDEFECPVCLVEYPKMEGIVLKECLHVFCRTCLANTIQFSEEAEVKCPYRDDNYTCDSTLLEREIKALVTPRAFEEHLAKSIALAETKIGNAFHCKTPDCVGWCIYEDNVNVFKCPVCTHTNCLTCQAIHEGLNCKQYQEQLNNNSEMNIEVKRTKEMLQEMVDRGEAMNCPTCQVVLMKKWGCDWLRCSMCKTEICWITRGPRWGPNGKGDTSGGCQCGVNGIKCHPKCTYCH